jgi:hypothetical protein
MSRIISLTRRGCTVGIPDTFVLGQKPIEKSIPLEDSPAVSALKYYESSPPYVREHQGPIYIVEFEDSTVKRIIPKEMVIDIGVETKKDEDKLPSLPKGGKSIE